MSRWVETSDGWRLGVHVHPATGERRGTVVALHAMGVDSRSLDRPAGVGFASTLAAHGWEVWRSDFRGHGLSGPLPADGGRWTYDDLVRRDVPALVHAARQAGGPVVVAGHSLGGHVTAASCAEGLQLDGLVLLAGNIWMPRLEPSRRKRLAKAGALAPLDALARALPYVPMRRLGVWPSDEASGYLRDLCRFYWEDRWAARDGTDWLAGLADARTGPVLSVLGAADALLARPTAARLWADHFGSPVDVWLAGRGRLGLDVDLDHMGVGSSPEAGPLWVSIAGWLSSRVARSEVSTSS